MKNQNWFNAMVEFGNTINAIKRSFGVRSDAIAAHIQTIAAVYQDQKECEKIAATSRELCLQVGF